VVERGRRALALFLNEALIEKSKTKGLFREVLGAIGINDRSYVWCYAFVLGKARAVADWLRPRWRD